MVSASRRFSPRVEPRAADRIGGDLGRRNFARIHGPAAAAYSRSIMKSILCALLCLFAVPLVAAGGDPPRPRFDPELAERLGADERGMRQYVLCILKTGPNDAEITGEQRKELFAGHFANIARLAEEGKLSLAGPFGKNERSYRGLYVFNVATVEEAEALVVLDPAVKAGIFVSELTPWYGSAAVMVVNETHTKIEKPKE
jgi:uncharacterized protein